MIGSGIYGSKDNETRIYMVIETMRIDEIAHEECIEKR